MYLYLRSVISNFMKKYISINIVILFFVSSVMLYSQDNSIFLTYNEISDSNTQKLNFGFESTSFVKNNEYFDHLKGWTGIGFFIKPQLIFQPTKTTQIQAGYFLEKYSGLDKFSHAIPLFRVRQKLGNNWEMILGHLYGNLEHNLSEPVYRFDHYYSGNIEYGLQFLFNNRFIKNDFWVDWQKFIFQDDPYREEFVLGNSFNASFDITSTFSAAFPFQFTWTHAGGQINRNVQGKENTMSLYNTMAGINLKFKSFSTDQNIKTNILKFNSIAFNLNFHNYNAGANPPAGDEYHQPYNDGHGLYLKCNLDFGSVSTMIGYWRSDSFLAKTGEEIFLSSFENDKPIVELANLKISYERKISDRINLSFRTDFYYDLRIKSLYHSLGIYFIYNDLFLIKNMKLSPD